MRLIQSYLQYQQAPRLNALIDSMQDTLLIKIDEFYTNFINIMTCDAQALDNYGVILNRSRVYYYYDYSRTFGFNTGEQNHSPVDYPQNFNHGSFFSETTDKKKGTMSDTQYRYVLLLTYQRYSSNCSVESCSNIANNFIQLLYNNPNYNCTIKEGHRHFTYNFNYKLSVLEQSIFKLNQELPKPAGIGYSVIWKGQ